MKQMVDTISEGKFHTLSYSK